MTNKELCENRIRELCPELMELSFGCNVKVKTENIINKEYVEMIDGVGNYAKIIKHSIDYSPRDSDGAPDRDDFYSFEILLDGGIYIKFENELCEDDFEILGHPIHLEHIIKAVRHREVELDIFSGYGNVIYINTIKRYDFKFSFNQQSNEFYQFLLELLK